MNLRMNVAIAPTAALFFAWTAAAAGGAALNIIADWPDGSRDLAGAVVDQYGPPNDVEATRLIWTDRPPWRKIVVYRDAADREHPGILKRSVSYVVPVRRWRALGSFGHGVEYDPVNSELGARTDSEETNFLALNLADEIVRGRLNAADAAAVYDRSLALLFSGKSSSYVTRLRFRPN